MHVVPKPGIRQSPKPRANEPSRFGCVRSREEADGFFVTAPPRMEVREQQGVQGRRFIDSCVASVAAGCLITKARVAELEFSLAFSREAVQGQKPAYY